MAWNKKSHEIAKHWTESQMASMKAFAFECAPPLATIMTSELKDMLAEILRLRRALAQIQITDGWHAHRIAQQALSDEEHDNA